MKVLLWVLDFVWSVVKLGVENATIKSAPALFVEHTNIRYIKEIDLKNNLCSI